MTIFESKDVEQRFYEVSKKYGIMHVLWAHNHVVTEDDIDGLISTINGTADMRVTSEAFQDAP